MTGFWLSPTILYHWKWPQVRTPTPKPTANEEEQDILPPQTKPSANLHVKTLPLIFVVATFAPLGNILLSKGMRGISPATNWQPAEVFHILFRVLSSPFIWLGIASLLAAFVAYMLVLTWADYSYVQPAASFSYAVVAMLSYFLLREAVPPLRWVGIAIICLGIFIVGHTHPRTTEKT